ncbi:hypothetical protein K7432_007898 [Basidiobolus ranarum]|uniref:Uncharacterized protein n=1 Tax=Basidiobolus ranarum TaxID=34480 RepID=A0ABR2WSL8_9FUNG
MERNFIGDNLATKAEIHKIKPPTAEEVAEREAQRLANVDDKGNPREGGSAGRAQNPAVSDPKLEDRNHNYMKN